MPRNLLSDVHVRSPVPRKAAYRLRDGDGLFLYVPPSGVCSWQYRYKLGGKHQTLTLGKATELSLAQARDRAGSARLSAADGVHLTTQKRVRRASVAAAQAATFQSTADEWVAKLRSPPWSERHKAQVVASIRNHLWPLAAIPVTEINARMTAPVLAKLERSAPLMFAKVRVRLHRIMDHAVLSGVLERNPLPSPEPERKKDRRHYPAVTELRGLGAILSAARAADPAKGIQRAHLLLAFTAQRVSEVTGAEWAEFNLKKGIWSIPRSRMKRKDEDRGPHLVPIPPQLLGQMRDWRTVDGKTATMVCVAPRDPLRAVTPEGVEKFYRDALGLVGRHSPHSWRSAFSTVCREAGKDGDQIEAQLDHVVGNKVASAYDRAKRVALRVKLMEWYEKKLLAARDRVR